MSITHTVAAVIVAAALATGGIAGSALASPSSSAPGSPSPATTTPPARTTVAAESNTKSFTGGAKGTVQHPQTIASPGTPSPYDSFANAEGIASYPGFYSGQQDTKDATLEPGELHTLSSASNSDVFNTIWVKWTAPDSGLLFAETYIPSPLPAGTTAGDWANDTTLAVFTGSTLKTAKRIAYDDDTSQEDDRSVVRSIPIKAGTTYHFQIGISQNYASSQSAVNSHAGYVELYVSANYTAPTNDNFGSAKTLTGTNWSATGTTLGSSLEIGETNSDVVDSSFSSAAVNSVWYKWSPAASGTLSFESIPTNLAHPGATDQYLAIYQQDGIYGGLNQVYWKQDSEFQDQIPILAESTYYFQLGQTSTDAAGSVDLNVGAVNYTGPLITKLSSTSGSHSGGKTVTLTGTGFTGVIDVCFGPVSCTVQFTVVSATKITVTTPAMAKGTHSVFVYDGSENVSTIGSKIVYKAT
jgi:hypothetical protein